MHDERWRSLIIKSIGHPVVHGSALNPDLFPEHIFQHIPPEMMEKIRSLLDNELYEKIVDLSD